MFIRKGTLRLCPSCCAWWVGEAFGLEHPEVMVQAARMVAPTSHDAYIANAPEPFQPLLEHLRSVLKSALPDAEEVMSYDMPGFRVGDEIVVGYAAFSKQCGLYCAPAAISECAGALSDAGLRTTKTGVTFTPKRPIPDDLITRLAMASRRSVDT